MWKFLGAAKRSIAIRVSSLILLTPAFIFPQGPVAPLSFEVASVKPAETITPAMIASGNLHLGMSVDGARVDIGSLSLAELIPMAFKVKPHQVSGPEWMKVQRFDILAKMPEGATKDQVPDLLRALLEERFQLKVHRENREQEVYALVVGKGGPKLKESPPETNEAAADAAAGDSTFGAGGNQVRINAGRGGATLVSPQTGPTKFSLGPDRQMHMEMGKVKMATFADMLTRFLDRPVIDMTRLEGNYEVALDLSMETMLSVARASGVGVPALGGRGEPGRPADASDPSGGSVFASVQQLGLRLESRKAPTDFVVVDHVEKMPSEN